MAREKNEERPGRVKKPPSRKFGHWTFKPSNLTFEFRSPRYLYEVDVERDNVREWLYHLRTTKEGVMSPADVEDLARGLAWLRERMPTLPVFTNPDPKWLPKNGAE